MSLPVDILILVNVGYGYGISDKPWRSDKIKLLYLTNGERNIDGIGHNVGQVGLLEGRSAP